MDKQKVLEECVAAINADRIDVAKALAEAMVADHPTDHVAISLLGSVHFRNQDYGSAFVCARASLDMANAQGIEQDEYWFNLASVLSRTYHFDESKACYEKALAIKDDAQGWANFAGLMVQYGRADEAVRFARKALELDPNETLGHTHLGMGLLLQDNWTEGWPHLEYRKMRKGWTRPVYPFPTWDGSPTDTLIIHGEQGLGDEIFFCSLVPRLRDRVGRIVIECNHRLVPLLRRSLGCEVYGSFEEAADNGVFDPALLKEFGTAPLLSEPTPGRPAIIAMGSLPMILGVTREDCANNAYLKADRHRVAYWRARLKALAEGKPIVGVAWQGGAYETHRTLRNPPREMFTRMRPDKYCLVSVQYTEGADRQATQMGMLHFPQAIKDIDEQAAIIAALDCLVTVAQTAMHIAGGLNVPTAALINQHAKWDCGFSGDTVPWWASVKAIRQRDGDWSAVFDKLLATLGEEPVSVTDKAMRYGPMIGIGGTPDLAKINVGGRDATESAKYSASGTIDARAAE